MSYDGEIIDAHQHFWDLQKYGQHYQWIAAIPPNTPASALKVSYLLNDFEKDIRKLNVSKSVHVQAEWRGEEVGETKWIHSLAEENKQRFPQAIVPFVDFGSPDVEVQIRLHLEASPLVRGVRQQLNWCSEDESKCSADRDYLNDPIWRSSLGVLEEYNLLFELHLNPNQLHQASLLCQQHPNIKFVLNHLGCPSDRSESGHQLWLEGIKFLLRLKALVQKHLSHFEVCDLITTWCKDLASNSNAFCKISGLIHPMYTEPGKWSKDTLKPRIQVAVLSFGSDRCLFGSNFPVDGVCGTYAELLDAIKNCFDDMDLSFEDQQSIFYSTAARLYRI